MVWKYVYIDDISTTIEDGHTIKSPANIDSILAISPKKITYDVPADKCYIHTNEEVPGLVLHGTDMETVPEVR